MDGNKTDEDWVVFYERMAEEYRRRGTKKRQEALQEKRAQLERAQADVDALQTEMDALKPKLDSAHANAHALQNEVDALETKLDGIDGKVPGLQAAARNRGDSTSCDPVAVPDGTAADTSVPPSMSSTERSFATAVSTNVHDSPAQGGGNKGTSRAESAPGTVDNATPDPIDSEDDTPLSRRDTRHSMRGQGVSIDSLKKKTILEHLNEKKSGIYKGSKGSYVVLSCHNCSANRVASRTVAFRKDNYFCLDGLRKHYRKCPEEEVSLGEDQVFAVCKKTVLTGQDVQDILGGKEPSNPDLEDRTNLLRGKKRRSSVSADGNGARGIAETAESPNPFKQYANARPAENSSAHRPAPYTISSVNDYAPRASYGSITGRRSMLTPSESSSSIYNNEKRSLKRKHGDSTSTAASSSSESIVDDSGDYAASEFGG